MSITLSKLSLFLWNFRCKLSGSHTHTQNNHSHTAMTCNKRHTLIQWCFCTVSKQIADEAERASGVSTDIFFNGLHR